MNKAKEKTVVDPTPPLFLPKQKSFLTDDKGHP